MPDESGAIAGANDSRVMVDKEQPTGQPVQQQRPRIHRDNLHELFTYHAPTGEAQLEQYNQIRQAAFYFANTILANAPPCADQQAALRKIREAMMTANAAIATNGMC